MTRRGIWGILGVLAVLAIGASTAHAAPVGYSVGAIRMISATLGGQNAEVEQAVDPTGDYVYEEWIGAYGIGFARSTDGGLHFGKPRLLPGSAQGWDPALAVGPSGIVYAAFMVTRGTRSFPVVVASFDHGASFPQLTALRPHRAGNWGDRDFIAAGSAGQVYVTWDYGPSGSSVRLDCSPIGSCSMTAGRLNIVMQTSTDGGKTFGPMVHVSPGFPASGGVSAPLLVEPSGKIDVLYARYPTARHAPYALGAGGSYFTASTNGGGSWRSPVRVGPSAGTITPSEWWIDGDLSSDAAGNLYATWDTQSPHHDIGWLSYSTDGGVDWSHPIEVSRDTAKVGHIVQVAGGPAGIAYVAWLSNQRPWGYAEHLRTFAIARGWLSQGVRISRRFGIPSIWPGDTFGISTIAPNQLVLSWGSALRSTGENSEIFAVPVRVALPPS